MPAIESTGRAVVARYPVLQEARLTPLGNRGGFSGARLWRVETAAGAFCLRAWPTDGPSADQLQWIHGLMRSARSAGLTFVPAVLAASTTATQIAEAGRLWDVSEWLPGQADFHDRPDATRLAAACAALARLHAVWGKAEPKSGPCPAVMRRLEIWARWTQLVHSGWRPQFDAAGADISPWARRAWEVLKGHPELTRRLEPWTNRALPLQPCLCDIWHDHVLFTGEVVTGLIDYGSVKVDHVAVDLARLLGSLAGNDTQLRASGLGAYCTLRPLSAQEEEIVGLLDETGTIIGAANWLRWLYHERRRYEDLQAVSRRLGALVERIEGWR
jgi:homoserine kinase type II